MKSGRAKQISVVIAGLALLAPPAAPQSSSDDFANKSIEELMNVDVTTVSRKEQKLAKVPAAVYVITKEMIERSGAQNIPDLLRMAPGVHVAQVEADRWAISIRGFDASYSNKLLVLIDGRTVYTPTFSGVYWDQIDIPLDTIERIEVVRGSGGSVWGANAVNGVINIITEDSKTTQGGRVEAGGGSAEAESFAGHYGANIAGWGTYRVFGDYRNYNGLPAQFYGGSPDGWDMAHGGFRIDGRLSSKDQLMVDADGYDSNGGSLLAFAGKATLGAVAAPISNDGFHVLARWTHAQSDTSESTLQFYENEYHRDDTGVLEHSNTADLDFQNHTRLGTRNDLVWGAGYRFTDDGASMSMPADQALATEGLVATLTPKNLGYSLFSGFVQDEFALSSTVSFTVGSKLEHNAFTGFEFEPTARLAWTPGEKTTVWAAVSRSLRQPSRVETGLLVDLAPVALAPGVQLSTDLEPNRAIQAETVNTYEAGYRWMPVSRLSFDITSFYSDYRHLYVEDPGPLSINMTQTSLTLNIPSTYSADGSARNYGTEFAATANVLARWRVSGSYAWFGERAKTNLTDTLTPALAPLLGAQGAASLYEDLTVQGGTLPIYGTTPENSFSVQSYFDVTRKWSFNQAAYYVGPLTEPNVPAYVRLDANCSYKLSKHLLATLAGQNLLDPRHLEFAGPSQLISTEPERSIFGKLTWSF